MKLGPGFPPTSISGEEKEREISDRVKDRMSVGVQWQLPSVVLRSSAADVSLAFPFAVAAPFAPAALRFSIATTNRITPIRCLSALNPSLKATLDKVVTSHKIVLFMKGTKEFPQCGFSNTVVQILTSLNAPFETVNILENEALRQGLKEYSSWPTFPQLYIDGEFFGGCDITVEAYKSGELQEVVERTLCS